MRLLKILYFYYYQFYTRVIPDVHPHATVIFALSFTESLWVNGFVEMITLNTLCYKIDKWLMLGVLLLIIILNYIYYNKMHSAEDIINKRPKIGNSNLLSVLVVAVFTIVGVSWLFWGSFYSRSVLENCY